MDDHKSRYLAKPLHDYILETGVREPAILAALREETRTMAFSMMQITADQGAFMALLVRLLDMRRILEIGVFTGYSSLAMALALPDDGRITALDTSEEWTAVARRYWRKAGVADKIELRLAPAADSLQALRAAAAEGTYDFAFIDADKENYPAYYEHALALIRPGGLIALDNAFNMGRVVALDDPETGPNAAIIDGLNRQIRDDDRVDVSLIGVGDGLYLCRKRL